MRKPDIETVVDDIWHVAKWTAHFAAKRAVGFVRAREEGSIPPQSDAEYITDAVAEAIEDAMDLVGRDVLAGFGFSQAQIHAALEAKIAEGRATAEEQRQAHIDSKKIVYGPWGAS